MEIGSLAPEEVSLEEPADHAYAVEPEVMAPLEGDFHFDDEAPAAGLEHLDPFAAAFDVLVKKDGQQARPAARAPETPLAGFAGPVPVDVNGLPLVATPEPEVLPAGADIGIEVSAAEELHVVPVAAEQPAAAAAAAPGWHTAGTIEEYLTSLLAFDPAAPAARRRPSPVEPVPRPEAASTAKDGESEDLAQFQEWLRSLKR
jgi:hypothetical protein